MCRTLSLPLPQLRDPLCLAQQIRTHGSRQGKKETKRTRVLRAILILSKPNLEASGCQLTCLSAKEAEVTGAPFPSLLVLSALISGCIRREIYRSHAPLEKRTGDFLCQDNSVWRCLGRILALLKTFKGPRSGRDKEAAWIEVTWSQQITPALFSVFVVIPLVDFLFQREERETHRRGLRRPRTPRTLLCHLQSLF